MSFDVTTKFTDHIPALLANLHPALHDLGEKLAQDVVAHAQPNTPVDTGATRNSIAAHEAGDLTWSIGPSTDYAIFLEFGTVHMPPRPFMGPALEAIRPFIEPAVTALIERETR